MSPYWSYVLTALGALGLLLAGSRKRLGWALGLAAQPLWITYAVVTGQWGFILSGLIYGGVYLRNWLKWRREADRVMLAPPWRTHREEAQYATGRWPPRPAPTRRTSPPPPVTYGQQAVAGAVRPARSRPTPPPPDVGFPRACPPACGEMHTYSAPCLLAPCHPLTGYHSTPHRGCLLR